MHTFYVFPFVAYMDEEHSDLLSLLYWCFIQSC